MACDSQQSFEQGVNGHPRPGYAMFVDLADREVAVVGGGVVAQRKIETLLPFGAHITLISPDATEYLRNLASEGAITWVARSYEPGDLQGALIAFCACGNPEVDLQVYEEARESNILLNVVDVPERCTFTVPSTLARGPLRIAVSTSGCSPVEARQVRRTLEGQFDESWGPYLDLLHDVRALIKQRVPGSEAQRKPLFEAAAGLHLRERLAAGEVIAAEDAYREVLESIEVPV